MCMAILRWAAPRLQFTFLGSYVCIGSRKISPREIPTRKILTHQAPPPLENSSPKNSHSENFHLEYSHLFHYLSGFT